MVAFYKTVALVLYFQLPKHKHTQTCVRLQEDNL